MEKFTWGLVFGITLMQIGLCVATKIHSERCLRVIRERNENSEEITQLRLEACGYLADCATEFVFWKNELANALAEQKQREMLGDRAGAALAAKRGAQAESRLTGLGERFMEPLKQRSADIAKLRNQ